MSTDHQISGCLGKMSERFTGYFPASPSGNLEESLRALTEASRSVRTFADYLARDLARRLPPGSVVLPDEPSSAGTRRIVLDVLYFAGDTTGKIVLTGGWSLLPPGSDVPLLTREVHLRDTTDPSDYANQVTAMSRLSGLPADEIAHV
jgi:uncharacterized lipoprotein YmbA